MHLLQSKCFREWSSNDTIGDKWVKPKVRLWWGGQAAHQSQSFCKTSFLEIKNMQTFSLSQWRMEANESHQRQINKLINGQLLKLGGRIIPVTITFPGCQALQPLFELSQLELRTQRYIRLEKVSYHDLKDRDYRWSCTQVLHSPPDLCSFGSPCSRGLTQWHVYLGELTELKKRGFDYESVS